MSAPDPMRALLDVARTIQENRTLRPSVVIVVSGTHRQFQDFQAKLEPKRRGQAAMAGMELHVRFTPVPWWKVRRRASVVAYVMRPLPDLFGLTPDQAQALADDTARAFKTMPDKTKENDR